MDKRSAGALLAALAATSVAYAKGACVLKPPSKVPTVALIQRDFEWDTESSPSLGRLTMTQLGAHVFGSFDGGDGSTASFEGSIKGRKVSGCLKLKGDEALFPITFALDPSDYDSFNGNYRFGGKTRTLRGGYRRDLGAEEGDSTVLAKIAVPKKFQAGVGKLPARIALAAAVQIRSGRMLPSRMARMTIRIPYVAVNDGETTYQTTTFRTIHAEKRIVDLSLVQNLVTVGGKQYWEIQEPIGSLGLENEKALCGVVFEITDRYPDEDFEVSLSVDCAGDKFAVHLDPASTTTLTLPVRPVTAATASSD